MITALWMKSLIFKGSELSQEQSRLIESLLETDRNWSAYALADLEPEQVEYTEWLVQDQSVVLIYTGLTPPVLFAEGPQRQIYQLMQQLPAGEYQISLKQEVVDDLKGVQILKRVPMVRMVLREIPEPLTPHPEVVPLKNMDQSAIESLLCGHADAPDGYHPRQLEYGHFFGIWKSNQLIAMAGIHLCSNTRKIAAVGNVFTDPTNRAQGLAKACTHSVIQSLQSEGIETVVLNVGRENQVARRIYRSLGFQPYVDFSEGIISVT
jgi:ribosomal protein S18 acetylase RimI-like enzyme